MITRLVPQLAGYPHVSTSNVWCRAKPWARSNAFKALRQPILDGNPWLLQDALRTCYTWLLQSLGEEMLRIIIALCLLIAGWTAPGHAQSCAEICAACRRAVSTDSVYSQNLGAIEQYCNACNSCGQQPQYSQPNDGRVYCSAQAWCQAGTTCCGNQCCHAGAYCSSAGCIPQGSVDCGGGKYCPQGSICWTARADIPGVVRRGEVKCPTPEGAAQLESTIAEQEQERRRKQEEAREARRRAEIERREAAQKRIEEQREVARLRQEQQKQEALRRKEEEDRRIAEKKRQEEEVRQTAQRKKKEEIARRATAQRAEDALLKDLQIAKERQRAASDANRKSELETDNKLRAMMNDPNQTPAARAIAAIALGQNPPKIDPKGTATASGRTASSQPYEVAAAERDLAIATLGKGGVANPNQAQTLDDQLRATMNNVKESPASRQIAAIALGVDPASLSLSTSRKSGTTITPAQLQFLKQNAVALTPLRNQSSGPTATSGASIGAVAPVTGFAPPTTQAQQLGKQLSADSEATKIAKLRAEVQQETAKIGLPIDSKTAARVLPYALMSKDSYSDQPGNLTQAGVRRIPTTWETLMQSGGVSASQIQAVKLEGFSAAIYRNDKSGEIVVAFRGTDQRREFVTSDLNGRMSGALRVVDPSYVDPQYQTASDLLRVVKQKWPTAKVSVTGHSLGGCLASYAGAQNGISNVVTFNAARNSFCTSGNNPNQVNVSVAGDVVGDPGTGSTIVGTGRLPGQLFAVPTTSDQRGALGLLGTHSIDGIVGGLDAVSARGGN